MVLPEAVAVALPSLVLPTNTSTVLPASAVMFKVGVVSLVLLPLTVIVPVIGATSSVNPVMVGADGAVVSMVRLKAGELTLVLPTPSVALAVKLLVPELRVGGVKV